MSMNSEEDKDLFRDKDLFYVQWECFMERMMSIVNIKFESQLGVTLETSSNW